MAVRGDDDETETTIDPDIVHEGVLSIDEAHRISILCGETDQGEGTITLSMADPWEVMLVGPGNSRNRLLVNKSDDEDRYYATMEGIPVGDYSLEISKPPPQ